MKRSKAVMLAILIGLAVFIFAACGAGQQSGALPAETIELETTVEVVQEEDKAVFHLKLENKGEKDVILPFTSGQLFEVVVTNEAGDEVHRYSIDKSFMAAFQEIELPAGEALEGVDEWDYTVYGTPVESGEYTVEVEFIVFTEGFEDADQLTEDMLQASAAFDVIEVAPKEDGDAEPELPGNDDDPHVVDEDEQVHGTDDDALLIPEENQAFRNLSVSGSNGQYTVKGEASVFEATVSYTVSDGHIYLTEDFVTATAGGPEWGDFEIRITIDENQLPVNGTITLELFSESAKDGSRLHEMIIPLESFGY